ncbi:hypothetical protein JN01_0686 [Entomoplasma freundtii]|uniref:Uncharacterized protein n=1 Tax=Entomoplasma freundtii TaxID=74700 RepID=A0A2K8NUN0_9MOLU|nr:hypothetical protein [Entomoplasma freundtii]ATZ16471.1 hypothetical protein EFREU_v1c04450 [Entomoplasma freundtii]TDY56000.1 hypothetical protein JN01_0686 [Entomoplasma freundtii]
MTMRNIIMGLGSVTLFTNVSALNLSSTHSSFVIIKEHNLSHPNFLEEGYFTNEMRKFFMDYQGFNGKLKEESHDLKIADINRGFFETIQEREIFDEFVYGHVLIKNLTDKPMLPSKMEITNIDSIQTLSLDSKYTAKVDKTLSVNYNGVKLKMNPSKEFTFEIHKETSTEVIMPNPIESNKCMISETKVRKVVTYKQSLLYIPLDNDAICKTIIDNKGHRYTVTPRSFVEKIQNDSKSLSYYLGNDEFLQYKDFIGQAESDYLIWMAIKVDDFKIDLKDFSVNTKWNVDIES